MVFEFLELCYAKFAMLSKEREKIIKSLQTKKGRQKSGLCLVEGKKVIEMCGDWLDYQFDSSMTDNFDQL